MKKFLHAFALAAMMLPFANGTLWGQEMVTVGAQDSVSSYLPMNTLYNYSYTQQIYTAGEIGTTGTIDSITLWMKGNTSLHTMPFTIYMVETEKESFDSNSDWVTVTVDDSVYAGTVTVHNTEVEAYTFVLDTPFEYSGTGNLLIAFNNTTGEWTSGLRGMVFRDDSGDHKAIYARQDGIAYDPYNPNFNATNTTNYRNAITLYFSTTAPVSIGDPVSDVAVSLFPNPASNHVTLRGIEGESTVMVVDMNGRTVFSTKASSDVTIDLGGIAKGAYFVRINGEKSMAIRKLIVK